MRVSTQTDAATSSAAPQQATSTSTPARSGASAPRCGSAAAGTPTARSSPPATCPGDRIADVLAITSTGSAYLFKGNGKGGLLAGRTLLSSTWQAYTDVLTPGDWTGDGKPDLLARKANGELWLLAGNGKSGFTGTWRRIGTGWQMFSQMVTPGDVTGDGRVDLLGRTPAGKLYLYKGTGVATATRPDTCPGP